jgi:hypothetical protein
MRYRRIRDKNTHCLILGSNTKLHNIGKRTANTYEIKTEQFFPVQNLNYKLIRNYCQFNKKSFQFGQL